MGINVLVTGAGGYIGRHVVKELKDAGAEVIATDLVIDGIDPDVNRIQMDIFSDQKDLFQRFGCPDACLHMAWRDGFVHNSPLHMGCLSNHYNFICSMINSGLKHLAVMGTMHEIGYFEGAIDENTPCNPISQYGIAKDALRRSLFCMLRDKDVVLQWLRAYYIYGDDTKNNSIFAKILQAEARGDEFLPFTSGKNMYDFIHVKELSRQLSAAVLQTEVAGIINCCTGKPVSLAEQVEKFIRENNLKIKLKYGAYPDRPYDSPTEWGNADKIKKIMGNAF
jgi:Nucleoside-diphosphate-sugar epimerases